MGNQEEIYRVKELGGIILNSVDVYGLDYSDLRSKYPARIVIGKDAAVAVERALQVIQTLMDEIAKTKDEKHAVFLAYLEKRAIEYKDAIEKRLAVRN